MILHDEHIVIGLALLRQEGRRPWEIKSFCIAKRYRGSGHASQLMAYIEQVCRVRQIRKLGIIYKTIWPDHEKWEHLLEKSNWHNVKTDLHYVVIKNVQKFKQSMVIHCNLNTLDYKLALLSPEKIKALSIQISSESWGTDVPRDVHPAQYIERLYSPSSLLLTYKDEVVGWIVLHRLHASLIQVTGLFIREKYRKNNFSIALVAEATRRIDSDNKVHFVIKPDNKPMLDFYHKYLRNYSHIYERRIRLKTIKGIEN